MSLLMDALKQAGEKKQTDATADETQPSVETTATPVVAVEEPGALCPEQDGNALSLTPAEPETTVPTDSGFDLEETTPEPEPAREVIQPKAPESETKTQPTELTETVATETVAEPDVMEVPEETVESPAQQANIDIDAEHQYFDKSEVAQRIAKVNQSRQQRQRKRLMQNGIALTITLLLAVSGYYLWASLAHDNPSVILAPLPEQVTLSNSSTGNAKLDTAMESAAEDTVLDNSLAKEEHFDSSMTWMENELSKPLQAESFRSIPPESESSATMPATVPAAITIKRNVSDRKTDSLLIQAYTDYQRGDFDKALKQYQQLLQQQPRHYDALLALAAIAVQQNQLADARSIYFKLVQLYPGDSQVLAALAALDTNVAQPSESHLKSLLVDQPNAAHLHFALANSYAAETRWVAAQQAYFEAQRLAPNQPDYAFNLAISLEHIGKPAMAATYYQRALMLASDSPARFEKDIALQRISALGVTP